jgi:hypothetical protein
MHFRVMIRFVLALAVFGAGVATMAGKSSLFYGVLQRSCASWDDPAIENVVDDRTCAVQKIQRTVCPDRRLARDAPPRRTSGEIRSEFECWLRIPVHETGRLRARRIRPHHF